MSWLPLEIYVEIFSYFEENQRIGFRLVSRQWCEVIDSMCKRTTIQQLKREKRYLSILKFLMRACRSKNKKLTCAGPAFTFACEEGHCGMLWYLLENYAEELETKLGRGKMEWSITRFVKRRGVSNGQEYYRTVGTIRETIKILRAFVQKGWWRILGVSDGVRTAIIFTNDHC